MTETDSIDENTSLLHRQGSSVDWIPDTSTPSAKIPGPSSLPETPPPAEPSKPKLSSTHAWIVIAQVCGINFVSSFSNGLLTVGLPVIAPALSMPEPLLTWPVSVTFLTGGSCLLISGSVADVIGPKKVFLSGCLLVSSFIVASGLAKSGVELILYRAFQGVANSMVIPSAISIISTNIEHGTPRNIGFAMIFIAQPLGFAMGMIFAGVCIATIGWRVGFYFAATVGLTSFAAGSWKIPKDPKSQMPVATRLLSEVDWVGGAIACGSIASVSYVLAMLADYIANIKCTASIAALVLSLALIPAFLVWTGYQEKRGKAALIPLSMWKNTSFTTICILTLLAEAMLNSTELFGSLFFQKVQRLSAVETSFRILPSVVVGVIFELLSGVLINKVSVVIPVVTSSILCAGSPLLMALINPAWPYWYGALWAQALAPTSIDVLCTAGSLIVASAFPLKMQALGGAVFATSAQLGQSMACALSVISAAVTARSSLEDKRSPEALLEGYRAVFWTLFFSMIASAMIGVVGLRRVGAVGMKEQGIAS